MFEHRIKIGNLAIHLILLIGASTMILPFAWMFLTSFKSYNEAVAVPVVWFPSKWRFDNYAEVINALDFGRYFLNTLFVTIVTTIVQLFFCSITAYGFSRLRFPGRDIVFFGMLCLLMVPSQMLLIPRYVMMLNIGWIDTYLALVMPHYVSIYGTFLLRQYFMALPKELEDAAKIDGCNYFMIYWKILNPLMSNAYLALGIYTVVFNWNDLLWPLMVINDDSLRTLSIGIASLKGENVYTKHLTMTAGVIATAPLILLFVVGQKYLISSIALSGIKG